MRGRVIAIAAAGLCALPAVASASVRTETVAVGQVAVVSATAECPEGQRATGGGWQSTPTVPEDVQVYPMESRKVGQSKWTVMGAQNSPNPSVDASMTAIVYCSKNAPRTTQEKKQITLAGDSVSYANAKCAKGDDVQAGGFSAPTNTSFNPFAAVSESYRSKDSVWRASGYGSGDLTSFAYCAARNAPKANPGTPLVTFAADDQVTTNSKPCANDAPLAGGFEQSGSLEAYEGFYESYVVGKRWVVAGSRYYTGEVSLTSIAYCD
jgi:hypothetical protein